MADMSTSQNTWTLDEAVARAAAMDGVRILVAGAENGAPEVAWGDVFVYADRGPADGAPDDRSPFATIVTGDYPGFDTASDLDRPGVYRLNVHVGRDRFRDLLGHGPEEHADHHREYDYRESDRLLPHPVYAAQSWISILNPGPRCGQLAADLLAEALERTRRHG